MNIREHTPQRTCKKKYKNYRQYKDYLREDFQHKCGYCNDDDMWSGGKSFYHIDHFAPKSLFSSLENEYSNLVYSCPFCNRAKSNDWVGETYEVSINEEKGIGYIDPCSYEYNRHLKRNADGSISPTSEIGEYMWNSLSLYLLRHRTISLTNEIFLLKRKLRDIANKKKDFDDERIEILNLICELDEKFDEYFSYLNV